MGNPLPIDDQVAKGCLSHHIRNGLQVAMSGGEVKSKDQINNAIQHIAGDLAEFGA